MDKFKGKTTCPTYNLNGDPDAALAALAYAGIRERYFVSKNVCHGVYYDRAMHAQFGAIKEKSQSLMLIWQGMEIYLKKKRAGKKFHDPLAVCCAIDRTIGIWEQVNRYRQAGEWGATLATNCRTWIIVDYDHEKFIRVLTAY